MGQDTQSKKRYLRLNWRSKLLLFFALFSLGPTTVLFYWGMQTLDQQSDQDTAQGIEGLAKARAQAVNQFMTDRVRQVETIATLVVPELEVVANARNTTPQTETAPPPELDDAKAVEGEATTEEKRPPGTDVEPEQPPDPPAPIQKAKQPSAPDPVAEATSSLRKTLGLILWDQREYEELLIIEPSGVVIASTFQEHQGKTAANIDYFKKGKLSTFIQHVFVSPITEKLTMVVATPIKTSEQKVVGVLAARLNLQTFFRLLGDQTGLGQTGETIVGKKIGSEIVLMAPTRHDPDAALKRKIQLGSKQSIALQDAARAQVASGYFTDYRGRTVFAASQHVPVVDWGLVVKIDQDESREAAVSARDQTVALAAVIILLALIFSALVSKSLVRPLRELKEATEKISKGDLEVKLAIRSRDEVGELADSFERMVAAIKFFREDKHDDDQPEG
jgi:HAMP domain-containing protein